MIKKIWSALIASVMLVAPAAASVFGPLANFDVVNDTGTTAHGFEIDIDGITPSQITSLFGDSSRWPGMERYGSPVVSTTPTGVRIVYQATYSNGSWSAGTPSGTLPVSPSDSCWPYGAPNYGPNYPCDHFGVSTTVNTPNTTYSWLVETSPGSSSLTPVLATVPNPVWTVGPAPVINNVPQPPPVNVLIVAPQPLAYEFGEPRWVKVTATGTTQDIAVEDLMAENAILKKAQTQVQIEWQLLQVDAGNPGSGQIDLTGVALDPGATGVVYRFEFYKYTGQRDPLTNEALPGPNGDTPGSIGPSPGDLGAFIVAQNAGINFDGNIPPAPPLPIAPTLNATIQGAQYGLPYSQVINATPGVPGDTLTYSVTGLPAGLTLTGNTISGTPTSIGTFPLVITVTDTTNGTSITGSTNLVVSDSPMTFPNPFTLAPATVGTAYSQTLSVTGGLPPYTFADVSNKLVTVGLSIVDNAITGTPTSSGKLSVTIQATDHLGYTQSATATLDVSPAGAPPPPVACSATNKVITSVGQTTIDIEGGKGNPGGQTATLPASINYISPAISLAIGELATFAGTLDQLGNCAAVTLTIAPGLSLGSPSGLPDGQVGIAYPTTAVVPAGGVGPYTLSVSGLPKSLSFDGTSIGGTPSFGMNGVYTIVISISDSVGESVHTNFSLTIAAPVLTVAPHPPFAGAAQFTLGYGDYAPRPTNLCEITGFLNGDGLAAISGAPLPTLSWGSDPSPAVGSYTLTCALGTLTAANYTFTVDTTPETIAVVPAVITVKPLYQRAIYGQRFPNLSFVVTGLKYGQTAKVLSAAPSLTTTAKPGAGVGTYPINVDVTGITAPNYTVVAGPSAQLMITPANLQVKALGISVKQGAPIPTFQFAMSGLTNGDNSSVVSGMPVITTTAVQGSPAGTYPIMVNVSGMSAANYKISPGPNATLTIRP